MLVHLENVVILLKMFHIKIASPQKHLYLVQMYIGGFSFILWHLTPGSTPGIGARGQNLELFKLYLKFFHEFIS